MRTGKLAISRGHQWAEPPHLALVPAAEVREAPVPLNPGYHAVHDRLTALERLTRLFEQGVLSAEEFAAEKGLILALPADELVLREAAPVSFSPAHPRKPAHGPSLLGRILGWWAFILASLVIGFGFSFVAQPDATLRLFDQVGRYFVG
jgi:hypothetical protein